VSSDKWMRLPSGVEVDRVGYVRTSTVWKSRLAKDEPWSFFVRQKDIAPMSEIASGGATLRGTDAGNQYGGVVPAEYTGWFEPVLTAPVVASLLNQQVTSSNQIVVVKGEVESTNSKVFVYACHAFTGAPLWGAASNDALEYR
jgi:hypothetical protein